MKTARPEAIEAITSEAQILETLNHSNIVGFKYFKEYFN